MANQKDIAKKQAEIVGQLQQFPIGRTNSGGRAGGIAEVVVTNPLPGQPRVVQAKCANDCPPGEVQLLRADDGSYVALSRSAAQKTSETTTRQVSRKNPTIPKKDEEIWPCTVAFVYSKIKPNTEILTDNGATDITSYDYYSQSLFSGTTPAMGFAQRFDDLGDYDTALKALTGDYKENRKLTPGGSGAGSGGAADNSAWGSAEGVIIWFYIGNPAAALTNGQIFKVSGPPLHPSAGNVTASGPGFAMEVYRGGVSSAIFPNENIGTGPLTKKVKESFPDLGGKIGYAGRIEKWRGVQDYIANSQVYYFRNTPLANQSPQTPVSYPPGYVIGSTNPWLATNASWYQFGWADPQYIGCASTSWINVETNAISAVACGSTIANSQWYWGGDASPSAARIDKDNPSGYIGTDGMFVCWQGHKDNAGMAQSFFETFKTYWGISGSVTKLGSANAFGCELPISGGGGYPPQPPGLPRFIIQSIGRKAEIWLKVCHQNNPPVEIKLPFEFAAVLERIQIIGNGTFVSGGSSSSGTSNILRSYGTYSGFNFLENPHATLSIDKEFAYINISYGAERIWESPLSRPIPLGEQNRVVREVAAISGRGAKVVGEYKFLSETQPEPAPRLDKDCFSYCLAIVVKLPTPNDKSITIVSSQRYKRGEQILLTAKSPDTEFDQKYLICDFKTSRYENIPGPPGSQYTEIAYWQMANENHSSFGGLPALIQFNFLGSHYSTLEKNIVIQYMPKFYKPQINWSILDKVHYQLLESPRLFSLLNEVLPYNVSVSNNLSNHWNDVIFDLDSKFGRNGRAEKISFPASFGDIGGTTSPSYSSVGNFNYPLFISFKEQLIGNGLLNNSILSKWYRISTSSFPILGQVKRNN